MLFSLGWIDLENECTAANFFQLICDIQRYEVKTCFAFSHPYSNSKTMSALFLALNDVWSMAKFSRSVFSD